MSLGELENFEVLEVTIFMKYGEIANGISTLKSMVLRQHSPNLKLIVLHNYKQTADSFHQCQRSSIW